MQITGLTSAVNRSAKAPQQKLQQDAPQCDRQPLAATIVLPNQAQSEQRAQQWQQLGIDADEPSKQAQKAVQSYQQVALFDQRDEIIHLLGVDLYA